MTDDVCLEGAPQAMTQLDRSESRRRQQIEYLSLNSTADPITVKASFSNDLFVFSISTTSTIFSGETFLIYREALLFACADMHITEKSPPKQ